MLLLHTYSGSATYQAWSPRSPVAPWLPDRHWGYWESQRQRSHTYGKPPSAGVLLNGGSAPQGVSSSLDEKEGGGCMWERGTKKNGSILSKKQIKQPKYIRKNTEYNITSYRWTTLEFKNIYICMHLSIQRIVSVIYLDIKKLVKAMTGNHKIGWAGWKDES